MTWMEIMEYRTGTNKKEINSMSRVSTRISLTSKMPLWSCVAKWYNLCQFAISRICWNVFEGNSLLRCVLVLSSKRFLHCVIRGIFQRSWLYPFPGLYKFNSKISEMPAVDMDLEWHQWTLVAVLWISLNILCCSCSYTDWDQHTFCLPFQRLRRLRVY